MITFHTIMLFPKDRDIPVHSIQMLPPSPEVKIFWGYDRFMDLLRSHWHPKFERQRENDELTACVNISAEGRVLET